MKKKMINKLVVEEFLIDKQILEHKFSDHYIEGQKVSWFKDPETGKYYRPKTSFEVTGEDLEKLFEEVEYEK